MPRAVHGGRLRIVARGASPGHRAQARGKLFEQLVSAILREHGYSVGAIPNVNYSGMELDVEATHILSGSPVYVECKAYETPVDAPKLHAFHGKYMTRWRRNPKSHGLFLALPGINSTARGFFNEYVGADREISVRLIEEPEVIELMVKAGIAPAPAAFQAVVPDGIGIHGDASLVYSDFGTYWVQFLVPTGESAARSVVVISSALQVVSEKSVIEALQELLPEIQGFPILSLGRPTASAQATVMSADEVAEVKGSSTRFEYQFPASPEHFVGRQNLIANVLRLPEDVLGRRSSCRSVILEANSGWGKSSTILRLVSELRRRGHFAVAIDSRSASSPRFALTAVEYVLRNLADFRAETRTLMDYDDQLASEILTGYEGAGDVLVRLGEQLTESNRLLFIFFDQFENLFFQREALIRIRDLVVKVTDAQTNVLIGFAWKTDLVSSTHDFPFEIRNHLTQLAQRTSLDAFSTIETNEMLDRLSEEIGAPLRKDLRFFLSDFSQGYPWLLKKLCAHVAAQRLKGVAQADIANGLLNVEQLFQEDLRGLSALEEETLRSLARVAPIGARELGEEFDVNAVQSLVDRRLVVRVGTKYDIYWDIFRDYLSVGKLPAHESYLLRLQAGPVLRAAATLARNGGEMTLASFQARVGNKPGHSYYNLLREMRLLGLARADNGRVKLLVPQMSEASRVEDVLRAHVRERLRRNRLVHKLLNRLDARGVLTIDEQSELLSSSCPYIEAAGTTWKTYARILADWLDTADLAIFQSKGGQLTKLRQGMIVPRRRVLLPRRRRGPVIPAIGTGTLLKVVDRLRRSVNDGADFDAAGITPSTLGKTFITLEDMGFIVQEGREYVATETLGYRFVMNSNERATLAREQIKDFESVAAVIRILEGRSPAAIGLLELGRQLRTELGANWGDTTAESNAKILLDWLRFTGLIPIAYTKSIRWPDSSSIK